MRAEGLKSKRKNCGACYREHPIACALSGLPLAEKGDKPRCFPRNDELSIGRFRRSCRGECAAVEFGRWLRTIPRYRGACSRGLSATCLLALRCTGKMGDGCLFRRKRCCGGSRGFQRASRGLESRGATEWRFLLRTARNGTSRILPRWVWVRSSFPSTSANRLNAWRTSSRIPKRRSFLLPEMSRRSAGGKSRKTTEARRKSFMRKELRPEKRLLRKEIAALQRRAAAATAATAMAAVRAKRQVTRRSSQMPEMRRLKRTGGGGPECCG